MSLPRSLKKYLFMYSAVLLLPLGILTYFCYSYLIAQFQNTVYQNEKAVYQAAAVQIEYKISQMRDLALQLSNTPDVLLYHLSTDMESQVNMIEMIRYSLSVGDSYQDLLLIDLAGNVYTSTGSYSVNSYSNIYQLPLEEIVEELNVDVINSGIRPVNAGYAEDNSFYFCTNYPYGSVYSGGLLIFRVDKEQFLSSLQIPCLVYYDDQLIAMNDNEERRAERYLQTEDPSLFNLTLQSGRVRVLAYQDEASMFQAFYQVRTQFMALEAVLAVVSLLLILFFSYRSYKPMKKLKTVMVQLGVGDASQEETAASIAAMEQLSRQNQEMDSRLTAEKYIVREMWLSKLVNHQYRSPGAGEILESLKEYGVPMSNGCYAVCVFQCSRPVPKELYPDTGGEDAPVKLYFFHDTDYRLTAVAAGDSLAKILLERAVAGLAEQFALQDIAVECFVGNTCSQVDGINASYIQALSMVRYDSVKEGKIHFFSDLPASRPAANYPQEELNRLLPALRDHDIQTAGTLFSVISTRIASDFFDFPFSKTVGYAVVNTLIKALPPDGEGESIRQYIYWLDRSMCKADILSLLAQLQEDLEKSFGSHEKDKRAGKMEEGIRFIDEHYMETTFYIGQAAEYCQISLNNFSQQFKHRFGVSPVKYLASMRIELAKRLLIETALPVNEVALRSGFSDISSFQRNFKANVSVTPTQYRAAHNDLAENKSEK